MKDAKLKGTIVVFPVAKTTAICLSMLDNIYIQDAKRIVKMLATSYGLTCS